MPKLPRVGTHCWTTTWPCRGWIDHPWWFVDPRQCNTVFWVIDFRIWFTKWNEICSTMARGPTRAPKANHNCQFLRSYRTLPICAFIIISVAIFASPWHMCQCQSIYASANISIPALCSSCLPPPQCLLVQHLCTDSSLSLQKLCFSSCLKAS